MSDPQVQLEGLRTGWDLCKGQDDQKHSLITVWHIRTQSSFSRSPLIQNLFAFINDLTAKLSEAELELRDKKDVIKLTRSRVDEGERQIQTLQLEKVR
jgi:hypothetical protein